MTDSLLQLLCADARLYHRLQRVDGGGSILTTALCSRGMWLLIFHRIAHIGVSRRDLRSPTWWLIRSLESIGKYLAAVFCKSDILEDCNFQAGIYLSNRGYLMCGAKAVGTGTLIHDHVTLGYLVANGKEGRPSIGSNVWVGPNTIIAGALTIGDGATILPGSYLTHNVPARSVVKGNPARVVRRDFDNATLRDTLAIVHDVTL